MIGEVDQVSADQSNWKAAGQVKGLFHAEQPTLRDDPAVQTPAEQVLVSVGDESGDHLHLPYRDSAMHSQHDTEASPDGATRSKQSAPVIAVAHPKGRGQFSFGGLFAGCLMLATILLPWWLDGTKYVMSRDLLADGPPGFRVGLISLWVIGSATVILTFLFRGRKLDICYLILGLLGQLPFWIAWGLLARRGSFWTPSLIVLVAFVVVTELRTQMTRLTVVRTSQGVLAGVYFSLAAASWLMQVLGMSYTGSGNHWMGLSLTALMASALVVYLLLPVSRRTAVCVVLGIVVGACFVLATPQGQGQMLDGSLQVEVRDRLYTGPSRGDWIVLVIVQFCCVVGVLSILMQDAAGESSSALRKQGMALIYGSAVCAIVYFVVQMDIVFSYCCGLVLINYAGLMVPPIFLFWSGLLKVLCRSAANGSSQADAAICCTD